MWSEEQKERQRRYNRTWIVKLKLDVFTHYSEGLLKCMCCGESNYIFLTLDHVNDDGAQHRKEVGSAGAKTWLDLRKREYPEGYQILCYNCNCGRAKNKGVCPHKEI